MPLEHLIIVHAFTSDEDGDHYLDDPAPAGTPVFWTAYERIIHSLSEPHESPWEIESRPTLEDALEEAEARCDAIGLPRDAIRVEHDPADLWEPSSNRWWER